MADRTIGKAKYGLSAQAVADGLAILMMVIAIAYALNILRMLNIGFYPQQYFAAILACVLPIAFLTLPASSKAIRSRDRHVPWYDIALAILSFVTTLFVIVKYPDLVTQIFMRAPAVWIPGLILTILLLEALRRATGLALVIIIAVFLLYALFGDILPGRLQGRAQNWQVLSGYMAFDSNGVLGLPLSVAATVVITFILFGTLLSTTGGTYFFTDAAMLAMGRFRGGSMKI
ncbi:MAG: TRAP transporter large permease subunit, partial [Salaquimonas sp.]